MPHKPTIYVFGTRTGLKEQIEAIDPSLDVVYFKLKWREEPDLSDFDVQKIEVVIGFHWAFGSIHKQCPNLKWFNSTTSGNERMFLYVKQLDIMPQCIYTRSSTVNAEFVSQYVITQILANEKCVLQMYENHKNKRWTREHLTSRLMSDVTVCILGLGNIGLKTAKLCKAFNMNVCGITRSPVALEDRDESVDEYRLTEDLHELLSRCDYIVNLLPSTNTTKGLLNGTMLSSCKKSPVLINVGRGDIINDEDTIKALREKWISKAILDVAETEPVPEESQLWTVPGVFITPHAAFGLAPPRIYLKVAQEFLSNYQHYINNETMENVLAFDRGY